MPKPKVEHTKTFVPKAPVGIQKPNHMHLKKSHASHTRHFVPTNMPQGTVHTRTFVPANMPPTTVHTRTFVPAQGAPITPARLLMANQAPVLLQPQPIAPHPHGAVVVQTQVRHRF